MLIFDWFIKSFDILFSNTSTWILVTIMVIIQWLLWMFSDRKTFVIFTAALFVEIIIFVLGNVFVDGKPYFGIYSLELLFLVPLIIVVTLIKPPTQERREKKLKELISTKDEMETKLNIYSENIAKLKGELVFREEYISELSNDLDAKKKEQNKIVTIEKELNEFIEKKNSLIKKLQDQIEAIPKQQVFKISRELSPKEKIQMLSKLIKNHTLAEIAIKDLEEIVHQEKDFYMVFNDLITYDRNPFKSLPGMNIQKYHVGKDVLEVRISQKYRFFVNNNRKLIIRITLEYNHPKMTNWFNNTTKY